MTQPKAIFYRSLAVAAAAGFITVLAGPAANAGNVIDTWSTVKTPPPPRLSPASVDSAHAALLILDMQATMCTKIARPRCVDTLPQVQALLANARSHHMLVVYSAGPLTSTFPPEPVEALARQPGEPLVHAPADKFFGGELEKILAAHNINTVIVTGTSAEGAVLYTASSASLLGITAVVPVDGMSSIVPFGEQYTAWHLKSAPATITSHVVLTRTDMITLR